MGFHHSLYHLPMAGGQDELFPLVFLLEFFELVEVKLNYIKSASLVFQPDPYGLETGLTPFAISKRKCRDHSREQPDEIFVFHVLLELLEALFLG